MSTNYPIDIPNNIATMKMAVGDSITITFKEDHVKFLCSDENEFYDRATDKYIRHGKFNKGDVLYGVAQNPAEFWYDYDDGKQLIRGVHTIIVGSTQNLDLVTFEKTLESDTPLKEIFCKCWPCAEELLKALVNKLPIPVPVKDFLEKLFDIGDEAYKKLCTQKKSES